MTTFCNIKRASIARIVSAAAGIILLSSTAFGQSTANSRPYALYDANYNFPAGLVVKQVAAGRDAHLALHSDGSLSTWGPVTPNVPTISNGVKIAASPYEPWFVVVKSDKTAWTWGTYGPLSEPAPSLDRLTGIVDVSLGDHHGVMLKDDGTVMSFGADYGFGELDQPVEIDHVVQVHAGVNGSIAVKDDGTVVSWGTFAASNASISALTNVKEVTSGYNFVLALKRDGTVVEFGAPEFLVEQMTGIAHIAASAYGALFMPEFDSPFLRGYVSGGIFAERINYFGSVQGGSLGPSSACVTYQNMPTLLLPKREFVGGSVEAPLVFQVALPVAALQDEWFDITSSDPSVTHDPVMIAAGSSEATGILYLDRVSANTIVKLTATGTPGSSTNRYSNRAIAVQSIVFSPSTTISGQTVMARLTLNCVPARPYSLRWSHRTPPIP